MDWQGVVAIAGVVVAFVTWATSARKSKVAELTQIIEAMRTEIDRLQGRVTELEAENRTLRGDNRKLVTQIARNAGRRLT